MVMQELNLIGNLTVAENLFLDRLPHRWGWIDYRRLHARARRSLTASAWRISIQPGRSARWASASSRWSRSRPGLSGAATC